MAFMEHLWEYKYAFKILLQISEARAQVCVSSNPFFVARGIRWSRPWRFYLKDRASIAIRNFIDQKNLERVSEVRKMILEVYSVSTN